MSEYNQIVQKVKTDEHTGFLLAQKLEEIKNVTIGQKAAMVPVLLKEKIVLEESLQVSLVTCQEAYEEIEELENKNEMLEHEINEYKKEIDPGKQEDIRKLCEIKNIEVESREKKSSQRMMKALERNYNKSREQTLKYLK
jgi:fructoselysine-6-P-deglycase FrlB-like protein